MKIAMLFPYAPAYRGPIYRKMDQEFDIDWFFCNNSGHGLKQMDYKQLKSTDLSLTERCIGVHSFWYSGISSISFEKYDVIIIPGQTHCLVEWYIAMRYGHKKKHPKVLFWTHGWYGKESIIQKILKKIYYHFADGILVYGDRAKRLMINEGFEGEKIYPIHNSLDYDIQISIRNSISKTNIYKNYFKNENPVLIFIGRLTKVKQLDLLIRAVGLLRESNECYNIVLVGDGEEKEHLQKIASELQISSQVWFYGACYDEKVTADLIFNADLCVAPGNIGLTAMHSLIFGTPCLTHNSFEWQMPEYESIKDGSTGCFFNYKNVNDLSSSIRNWFIKNSMRREEVRDACFQEIDSNWNPYYQIDILKKALSNQI